MRMPLANYSNGFAVESGARVRIVGQYTAGKGYVVADETEIVRAGEPVKASDVSMADIGLGDYWSSRVRIRATVEAALICSDRCQLVLRASDKRILARLMRKLTNQQIEQIVDAEVTIVGTLSYLVDQFDRPMTGMCLAMPTDEFVINEPGGFDYSNAARIQSLSELNLENLQGGPFEISGQVGHIHAYDFFVLEDEDEGDATLSIYAPFEGDLRSSDVVRVIAVENYSPEFANELPLLCEIDDSASRKSDVVAKLVIREHGSFLPPSPEVRASQVVRNNIHRQRATITGDLISITSKGSKHRLLLKEDNVYFETRFELSEEELESLDLRRSRSLALRGLVEQSTDELTEPARFSMDLSSPSDDITVMSRRPQIDRRTALSIVLGMSALIFAGLLFFLRLRNRYGHQRKDLENVMARLNSSYDAVHEALLVIDHKEGVVAANSKVESVLGLTSDSLSVESLDRVGERIANCFCEPEDFLTAWNQIQTDPFVTLDLEFDTLGIPRRSLSVYTAPVVNRDGEADGRIWSFDDVSQRKQLELNLMHAQKMEAVGRLAGGIAHDFNNLLLAMMTNIELARMQPDTHGSMTDEYLSVADEAADRAAKLVKQLLGFSRKTELEMEIGQPNLVVAEVERLLMRTFDSRIVLQFELDPELWHARIDANQLVQVLLNICLNARDALRGENDTITIATKNVDGPHSPLAVSSVCIRVSDNGSGMPESVRAMVFDPFFTTKEPGKGTGLGLSMSCLLYTSPSPRDATLSRMPSSA